MIFLDFDIETYTNETLSQLNIPVFNTRSDPNQGEDSFIVFQELKDEDALTADNIRQKTKFTILVKVFSINDLFEMNRQIETVMQKAKFTRTSRRKTIDIELDCNMTIYKFVYVASTIKIDE